MNCLNIIAPLSLLLILSACAGTKNLPAALPDAPPLPPIAVNASATDAERDFRAARDALKAGNAETALIQSLRMAELYPNTPWYKRSLFLREQALIRLDRTPEAIDAMLRVQADYPELADYGVILLADHLYARSRYTEAAALYGQVMERYPQSFLVARAAFQRAQALAEAAAYPQAMDGYDAFLQNYPRSEFAPAAGLGLGRVLIAEADLERAVRAYQDVWVEYPGNSNDREVEQALTMLRASGVIIPELASAELYERGRNLFRASLYDKAVETFTTFLKKSPDSPDRPDALYRTGVSLFNLGKRGEAVVILERLIWDYPSDARVPEALYWLGRSYSRLSDWEHGVKAFERLLEEYPDSEWRDDALFLIGNIFRETGDMEQAFEFYGRLVREYSDSKFADSAIWWKAWWHYTSGDYAKAEQTLQVLINRYPRSFLVNQALYWQGRSAENQNDLLQAAGLYEQVLKKGPYTYYGSRAAERKAVLGVAPDLNAEKGAGPETSWADPPDADDPPPHVDGDESQPQWTEEMQRILAAEQAFGKTSELAQLDMKKEASAELWSLKDRMPKKRYPLLGLSKVFYELEDYYHSLIIVLRTYERALERPSPGMSDDLWFLAYPRGYWESIAAYAGKYDQDPYFIAAIIKEESQFKTDALSPAGARGLMQVMPATGAWAAQLNKMSGFDREKLFDADTAINIGTWYVSHLMKRFQNDPLLVAAAYNAGPEAVQGWIVKNGHQVERDMFVEMIPYSETRGYVKKVLRNYAEYKRVYSKTGGPADPALQTNGENAGTRTPE